MIRSQVRVCMPGKSSREGEVRYEKSLREMVAGAQKLKGKSDNQDAMATCSLEDRDDLVFFDYYKHQLALFVHMCYDQQYLAIDFLREEKGSWTPLTADLVSNRSSSLHLNLCAQVLQCMMDEDLPCDLRSTFAQLMSHLHIVAHRESPLVIVNYAHLWTKIATDVSVDRQVVFCSTLLTFLFSCSGYSMPSSRRAETDEQTACVQFTNVRNYVNLCVVMIDFRCDFKTR